ncbi:MAG: efflux RND transporter periplasmic adaptor subunit [Nitrospirae bacterium]|nr:efflux RND transporter periplasmic adaptor subunit [Nitrospirota bacterium]
MTTRTKRFLYGVIILSVIAIVVFLFYRRNIVVVEVVVVKRGKIERTITGVSSGTVEPLRRVRLQPLLPLKIKEVNFKEGDRVKKGDVIVKLNDSEISIKLDIQKAALGAAEFRLHGTEERYRFASQNYTRAKRLFEEGIMPDSRFDEIKSQFIVAEKEFEIAKNAVTEARLGVRLAEEELEKTSIRTPFDGVISFLNATPGEVPEYLSSEGMVVSSSRVSAPETEPFCEIVDDSVLKVEVPFDEADVMVIRRGQDVKITTDTYPGKVFGGKVAYVSPVISKTVEQNRTVEVEVKLIVTGGERIPVGASVDAEIILEIKEDALIVPTNAVIERDGGRIVYTVDSGKIRKVIVKTGISSWEFIQILEGLKEGERVITSLDVEGLEEGRRAKIKQ